MKNASPACAAFLYSTLLLFALCNSPTNTSSPDTPDNAPFHPPSWLIGTWNPVKTSFVEPLKITSKNIYRISGNQEIEGFTNFVIEATSVINGQSNYIIATSDKKESYTFLYNSTASMTLVYTISGQTAVADFKKQ
jgi:hypothetical protein